MEGSTVSASDVKETEADASHGHHPTPREYVNIAIMLAILTALEVSTYFIDFGRIAIPLLIILMIVKFIMVASFFMHLKFDAKVFGRMLYGGLAFALVLYAATLMIFVFERAPAA
jgi:cytochrome c oxidase subunit IV